MDHLGAIAAACGTEEAAIGLEAVGRSRPAERRKLRRHHTVLRRAPGMEGLRHRPEIFAQAARLRGADAQCATCRIAVEAKELRRGSRGADRPAGCGAVKPVL